MSKILTILLPPKRNLDIDSRLRKKLAAALVTRYSPDNPHMKISMATASKYIPTSVHQWGQAQIHHGGDCFKCRALLKGQSHARDCTYVKVSACPSCNVLPIPANQKYEKYEAEVDFYERQLNRAPVMVKKTFFAELHRIVRLDVPANQELYLSEREELVLALVKTCKAEQDEHGFWKYSSLGGFEFIDLATIRCVLGRVYDRDAWYIIDRSNEVL